MIWNLYADNKDLRAKRAVDSLEFKKLFSKYENYVHSAGEDYRNQRERHQRTLDWVDNERRDLEAWIIKLEADLDAKSTLALTAQIRVDQLERAALKTNK